jgi:predicted nucleotidyltransferase/DNA-binding XRE family transcriptional regulator
MSAGTVLRDARRRARLSQTDLARRAGVAQSVISAYESGKREPSLRTLERLVAATGGRLAVSVEPGPATGLPDSPLGRRLRQRRRRVLDIAERYGVTNVRVFGSVARGEDGPDSDVDLLADVPPGTGVFRLLAIEAAFEEVLGVHVDVVPANLVRDPAWGAIAETAVPL